MAIDVGDFWIIAKADRVEDGVRLRLRSSHPKGAPPPILANADHATEWLQTRVAELVARLPGWTVPRVVAVYLHGTAAPQIHRQHLLAVGGVVVDLPRATWDPPRPWRLPLGVSAWGEEARRALARLEREQWPLSGNNFGMKLRAIRGPDLRLHLRMWKPKVLVVDGSLLADAFLAIRDTGEEGPHLVVTSGAFEMPPPPAGVALLVLPAPLSPDTFGALMLEIVHDLPLHAALAVAADAGFRLYADPGTNHGLRMRAALTGAVNAGIALAARGTLPALQPPGKAALLDILHMPITFDREMNGLSPLAEMETLLEEQRARVAFFDRGEGAQSFGNEPHARGKRAVDIALLRREGSPLAEAAQSALDRVFVAPGTALRRGARYGLRVQIGASTPRTLVRGDAPAVDPLLPPSEEGHVLDVAIFPLDFSTDGPQVKQIHLARSGPSTVATFEVRAPRSPGPARLRVGIYLGDHLVQSWALDAEIAAEERTGASLAATLVFSRTARLENLDTLGPRAASVGVNYTPRGSHAILFKKGEKAASIGFDEAAVSKAVEQFRNSLEANAVRANGLPVFPIDGKLGAAMTDAFAETIRTFGRLGVELFDSLLVRTSRQTNIFNTLIGAQDAPLQVVRYDTGLAFPWAAVYDFQTPEENPARPAPVCLGETCGGCRDGTRWCLRGFWGFRYQLEELIPTDAETLEKPEDPVTTVAVSPPGGGVLLAIGDNSDPSKDFPTKILDITKGWTIATLPPGDDLLARLWPDAMRPPVVVVLGHHEVQNVANEPIGARITLAPGKAWLARTRLARKVLEGRWSSPRSLVLLLTCNGVETTPATLNDFVLAFNAAGAGAIVGAECRMHAGLLARFGTRLLARLRNKETLGAALTAVRWELAATGNPLGFAFTLFGDATFTLT